MTAWWLFINIFVWHELKNGSTRKINQCLDKRQHQTIELKTKGGCLKLGTIPICGMNVFYFLSKSWIIPIGLDFSFFLFGSGLQIGFWFKPALLLPIHIFMNWKYPLCNVQRLHVPLIFRDQNNYARLFWITLTLPGNFPQNFRWTHLHPSKRWGNH